MLGDLITTTIRVFVVGRTGLGKTLFGMTMAISMAAGRDFLHWKTHRPARILYIDGEMPDELIKERIIDLKQTLGLQGTKIGNLFIYSRDMDARIAQIDPTLGTMPPLNTKAGFEWLGKLIGFLGRIDVVFFDNVMSIIAGDQKDEEAWHETQTLIMQLSAEKIGQVWLDHTGHDATHQYGSSTKSWKFDAVAMLLPLDEGEWQPGETAVKLSFEQPGGKARR